MIAFIFSRAILFEIVYIFAPLNYKIVLFFKGKFYKMTSFFSLRTQFTVGLLMAVLNFNSIFSQGLNCSSATLLTVKSSCQTTQWSNNEDGSLVWSHSCNSGTDYQDIWFRMVGTGAPVAVNIFGLNACDALIAIYSGSTCPISGASTVACAMVTGSTGGVNFNSTNGVNYYIQIQRRSGDGNGNSSTNSSDDQNGSICIFDYALTSCGNPTGLLNDFCESSATLTYGLGTSFSASTEGTFTPDLASTVDGYGSASGPFCGLVHNNSWYKFKAGSATENFKFTSTSCSGVQAQVFRITYNSLGCCNGFASVSNCLLNIPSPPNSSSVVTATGLTIGQEYVLMVDGYLGAECDFTIADWGAINVLPIELSEFIVFQQEDKNLISWKTSSEKDNDYFNLLRSFDGENFELIQTIKGAGNSSHEITYEVPDFDIRFGTVYYQLEQFDFDGASTQSKILTLNRNSSESGLVSIYPNPADQSITIDVNVSTNDGGSVRLETVNGSLIFEQYINGKGIHQLNYNISDLNSGMYFVRYIDSEKTSVKTILKR